MTIRAVTLTGLVIALACFRSAASTLVVDLFLDPPVHSYFPEWTVQSPNTGTTFTMAAESLDSASSPDAAGMIINLTAVTLIEFNLRTTNGSILHVSPSGVNYMLSYGIALEGWSLEGISSGASTSLLGIVATPPPWSRNSVSDDAGGSRLHGYSQTSAASYGFTGMRVSFQVPAQLANGQLVLKSAGIGVSSRGLYGDVDPGQAMSLIPIPEANTLLSVVFSAFYLLRRNRSSCCLTDSPQALREFSA